VASGRPSSEASSARSRRCSEPTRLATASRAVGFDWARSNVVEGREEVDELALRWAGVKRGGKMGDLLFVVTCRARWDRANPRSARLRFCREQVGRRLEARGRTVAEATLDNGRGVEVVKAKIQKLKRKRHEA
jgi:hypothetical protein